MGWTFPYNNTMADTIKELTETNSYTRENDTAVERICLAHCLRGFTLYAVMQTRLLDSRGELLAEQPDRPRWIMVCLLSRGEGGTWGYKDMDEGMGPCEVQCPLSYLEMCGDPRLEGMNNYAADWYDRVRAYHAKKKEQTASLAGLLPGDVLILREGCTPAFVNFERKKGKMLYGDGFRIKPSLVASVKRVPRIEYKGASKRSWSAMSPSQYLSLRLQWAAAAQKLGMDAIADAGVRPSASMESGKVYQFVNPNTAEMFSFRLAD